MSRSKIYGALSFMVVLHDGSGFLGPALRAGAGGGLSTAGAGGLRRTGDGVERAFVTSANLGVALSRTSAARNERGAYIVGPHLGLNEGSSCGGSRESYLCMHGGAFFLVLFMFAPALA